MADGDWEPWAVAEVSSAGLLAILGSFYNAREIILSSPDLVRCLLRVMPPPDASPRRAKGRRCLLEGCPLASKLPGIPLQLTPHCILRNLPLEN